MKATGDMYLRFWSAGLAMPRGHWADLTEEQRQHVRHQADLIFADVVELNVLSAAPPDDRKPLSNFITKELPPHLKSFHPGALTPSDAKGDPIHLMDDAVTRVLEAAHRVLVWVAPNSVGEYDQQKSDILELRAAIAALRAEGRS